MTRITTILVFCLILAGCAGPHEAPKLGDVLFAVPWYLKRQQAGALGESMSPQTRPPVTAPIAEEK